MNARFYVPSLARFLTADTVIPGSANPQAFNRYTYVLGNPLKLVDPSGHCWGVFSFVRSWTALGYDTTCNNIDQALNIINHPDANAGQRVGAATYVSFELVSHAGLVIGLAGAGCSLVAPCAQVLETALGLACADTDCSNEAQTVVNMACGDQDCTNEARTAYQIGQEGSQRVWNYLNDPTLQTEVKVYINEAGRRINYFARLDGLTDTAIHEVKNVANLSLTQKFMDQATQYKLIADGMGIELHYWLVNSAPANVVQWLQQNGIIVHTSIPGG